MLRPIIAKTALAGIALASISMAVPVAAHHSFAMFNPDEVRTLRGRVAEFRWANPHVALFVQVDGVEGREGIWSVELTSPGNLTRMGWARNSVKRGDRVEVEINPLRDGRHGGGFRKLTKLDTGKTYSGSLIDIERKLRGS